MQLLTREQCECRRWTRNWRASTFDFCRTWKLGIGWWGRPDGFSWYGYLFIWNLFAETSKNLQNLDHLWNLIMRFHVWLIFYNTSRDAHMSRDNFESSITSTSCPACECPPKFISNICNFSQSYQVSQTIRFLIMMIFLCFTFKFIMRGQKILNHSDAL